MGGTFHQVRRPGKIAPVFLLLFAVGCGSSTGTVSGKVTYNGQPVSGGTVNFTPADGQGPSKIAPIDEQGNYEIEKLPLGKKKVSIIPPAGPPTMPNVPPHVRAKMSPPKGANVPQGSASGLVSGGPKGPKIPEKYTDPTKSGLEVTVEGGSQTYDIPLK